MLIVLIIQYYGRDPLNIKVYHSLLIFPLEIIIEIALLWKTEHILHSKTDIDYLSY